MVFQLVVLSCVEGATGSLIIILLNIFPEQMFQHFCSKGKFFIITSIYTIYLSIVNINNQ